jgi:hypothetical protein
VEGIVKVLYDYYAQEMRQGRRDLNCRGFLYSLTSWDTRDQAPAAAAQIPEDIAITRGPKETQKDH